MPACWRFQKSIDCYLNTREENNISGRRGKKENIKHGAERNVTTLARCPTSVAVLDGASRALDGPGDEWAARLPLHYICKSHSSFDSARERAARHRATARAGLCLA